MTAWCTGVCDSCSGAQESVTAWRTGVCDSCPDAQESVTASGGGGVLTLRLHSAQWSVALRRCSGAIGAVTTRAAGLNREVDMAMLTATDSTSDHETVKLT